MFDPYANHSVMFSGLILSCGFVLFNTAILPVLLVLLSKRSLVKGSLADRRMSILFAIIVYTGTYLSIANKIIPEPLQNLLIATVIGLAIAFVVNYKFKLSLHTSGAGGIVAFSLFRLLETGNDFYLIHLCVTLFVAGIVGSSRLAVNAHTNTELYSGYAAGFFSCSVVIFMVG